ncbi:hypothetical protein EOD23_20670 [Mesorhizobium sp. USDA-HM6]|nr:hypothetical protein EOD23_20670 [Mesorhizobium sp. USDA-HM6]
MRLPPGFRAIPGKVCNGFPSGIAWKQIVRAVRRFRETVNCSSSTPSIGRSRRAVDAAIRQSR